jgi:DNA-binding beta-propeller fold protein YncE
VDALCCGVAVTVDGSLLLSDTRDGSTALREYSVASGAALRVIGGFGRISQACRASDGVVFVCDSDGGRIEVLSAAVTPVGVIGATEGMTQPGGVCASADVVVVSDSGCHRLAVFRRVDGSLLTHIGSDGASDGELHNPRGLCLMSDDRHIVVADSGNARVSVFSIDGEFVRHVGVGVLGRPWSVAASAFGELVVADTDCRCLHVFSGVGDLLLTFGDGDFCSVAVCDRAVFAVDHELAVCVVFR